MNLWLQSVYKIVQNSIKNNQIRNIMNFILIQFRITLFDLANQLIYFCMWRK